MTNLIFDMDGTIIDSNNAIVCAVNEIRANLGLSPMEKELLISLMNDPKKDFKMLAYENKEVKNSQEIFTKHYDTSVILHLGMEEFLSWCDKKGFNICMATNATSTSTNAILEKLGVKKYFKYILCAGDGYAKKPSPQMIKAILEKTKQASSVFIGDSLKDLEAAKAACVPFIMLRWYEKNGINSTKALKEELLRTLNIKERSGNF